MKITDSFTPSNLAEWRTWLAQNHDHAQEIWLIYFKAPRGKTNIDYESSVEEALCFGWVDSIIQTIDDEKYARKFNPRRRESKWSETNKRRVVKVIREGRMTEAGLAKVTIDLNEVDPGKPKPKRPPVKMPERLEKILKSHHSLWEAFQRISPSYQRNYILWLSDAKKPETFERRLQKLIDEVMAWNRRQCIKDRPIALSAMQSKWRLSIASNEKDLENYSAGFSFAICSNALLNTSYGCAPTIA